MREKGVKTHKMNAYSPQDFLNNSRGSFVLKTNFPLYHFSVKVVELNFQITVIIKFKSVVGSTIFHKTHDTKN